MAQVQHSAARNEQILKLLSNVKQVGKEVKRSFILL